MLTVRAFTFNPVQENTYVVYNDKNECAIIDPGCYFEDERRELRNFIEENALRPVLLLNTHCHLDHVFGNKFVSETWGLILHIHSREQQMLEMAPASGQLWQLPFDNYDGELEFLHENTLVPIGADELEIRFTPGHSPGHVSFYHEPGKFVISGDALFNRSIGRTDLPGGDFETLLQSIQERLFTLPDDTVVYSGHGPDTTIGFEKLHNPFVKLY